MNKLVKHQTEQEQAWQIQEYAVYAVATGEIYKDSGLGYHCERDLHVSGLSGGLRWDVDHVASGRRLASFNGQARARVFIEEVAPYTDWNKTALELQAEQGLWERVSRAREAASNWQPKEAKKLLQLRKQVDLWKEDDYA